MKEVDEDLRSEAEIRASLEQSTEDLRSALERLELGARRKLDVAKKKLDIGRRIARKGPMIYVVGFLAGMALGMLTAKPRRTRLHQ